MKSAMRIALACSTAALIAGCLSSGERSYQRYYVLEDSGVHAAPAKSPRASTLLVAPTTASGFYETQDIVYSRTPGTRAYYQYHAWVERPGRAIGELLVARLARGGAFKAITRATSGIQGELVLNTHLSEFYHDASAEPGSVRVSLTAELIDSVRRVLVARRTFTQTMPAATYDAPGAARALNQATVVVLDEVSAWVDRTAPR
ncbi:MAG TPA: ABC-type transport auxiliary lipoprotein family protein [Burkholderiales bacterium]|nr:ABC-type transport auxiliary lipoprotein family protein [Burkholderiales bacterium]